MYLLPLFITMKIKSKMCSKFVQFVSVCISLYQFVSVCAESSEKL